MINFQNISSIISKNFDIDLMDIKRNGIEIYSNIPCNIQINSSDNADTTSIDVVPIITSLTIHMNQYVDIQNNDYIVAKRMSNDRKILEAYVGVCGFPSVWQARKSVNMTMSTLTSIDNVTPPPPMDEAKIEITYHDEHNNEIRPSLTRLEEANKSITLYPVIIEGYDLTNAFLDGKSSDFIITIENIQKSGHHIDYIYKSSNKINSFRILINGVFTKDNGEVGYGYHLYRDLPIIDIAGENGNYEIIVPFNSILHEDNGTIKLQNGTKLKLFNSNEWVKIVNNLEKVQNGYKVITEPYYPTEQEADAYVTNWYGV